MESFENPNEILNDTHHLESSNTLDTSKPFDYSNDSGNSNFATEKDGNKETEGQIQEHIISEQNEPNTSEQLNYTDQTNLSTMDALKQLCAENTDGFNPDTVYEKGAHTFETDDNGSIFKIDGNLQPNSEYVKEGYTYTTDDLGRIISASGQLQIKDHIGRYDIEAPMSEIGKGDQQKGDERGHLIGDQFNGSPGKENLVPMSHDLNHGDYLNMEMELRQKVDEGHDVVLTVEPEYDGNSNRPSGIFACYTIDGEYFEKFFTNDPMKEE